MRCRQSTSIASRRSSPLRQMVATVKYFMQLCRLTESLVGGAQQAGVPENVMWPEDELLAGVATELYKIRNASRTVVGIAARTVSSEEGATVIDWVIHLPARGSLYVSMDDAVAEEGYRIGGIRTGSREFSQLQGAVFERWIANTSDEEDAPQGRIELAATYVSNVEPSE